MEDRISELPIPILHHILCFLSQKEAVKTCVLSKQWRHIGSTRPNLEFSEDWNDNTQEKFLCLINRTLQGYSDHNLFIHKLHLDFWRPNSPPVVSLLDKWIPMMAALNIKAFKLNFLKYTPEYHYLPSAVFLAESLEELHLRKCRLSPVESLRFKCLRTLTLEEVQVDSGTFGKITSGCPLLRRLVLTDCRGLRNVRLCETASPGLKHVALRDFERIEGRSIDIDVPNIETVSIWGPWIWSHSQSALLFSRITSLQLYSVILSSESFTFNAGIPHVPDRFSFTTTTSKEWSSEVFLSSSREGGPDLDINSWFLKLRRLLKALSGSQISLILWMNSNPQDVPCSAVVGDEPPLVVRDLNFDTCKSHTASWYLWFTNGLFRVCRPTHIWGCRLVAGNHRLSEFQFNILLANKSLVTETYFWQHDLEQVHVNGQLVQYTDLEELRNRTYDGIVCLELKWRGRTTA
ncbi:F-box/LRR-repeat protein [Striga hermonthica]|uniref:F-box/LRR-repeat protein n=1 Tax=Striga hermonthica TaxID=68872 RepID=A0A9N7MW19_STRHE|nr:F-box/LRR-repeat protein [Striga hermonthica]